MAKIAQEEHFCAEGAENLWSKAVYHIVWIISFESRQLDVGIIPSNVLSSFLNNDSICFL